jgi:CheY-like chemotaxis protein
VYSVVQQCHGYIAVQSVVDRGTLFQIFLPAVVPTPSRSFPALQAEIAGAETILLVEDDVAVRALATRSLRAHGYQLLEARDGLEAIRVAAAHQGPIDLLLTDVVMPRMGGRALAETLRQQRPTTRVLFMSGYPDDEVLRRGVQQDPLSFLEKPFTQATLGAKVRAVLDATLAPRGS